MCICLGRSTITERRIIYHKENVSGYEDRKEKGTMRNKLFSIDTF